MKIPLSAALVLALPAQLVMQDVAVPAPVVIGGGFVLLAGLAIGIKAAADDAQHDRQRWYALTHRLPRVLQ